MVESEKGAGNSTSSMRVKRELRVRIIARVWTEQWPEPRDFGLQLGG